MYMQKNYPTLGCTLYDGGGVKEVFGKHLLPFIPFIHRHSRHLGGGEEVFFDEKLFCHHFFLVLFELRSNWRVPPNLICSFLWRKEKN